MSCALKVYNPLKVLESYRISLCYLTLQQSVRRSCDDYNIPLVDVVRGCRSYGIIDIIDEIKILLEAQSARHEKDKEVMPAAR